MAILEYHQRAADCLRRPAGAAGRDLASGARARLELIRRAERRVISRLSYHGAPGSASELRSDAQGGALCHGSVDPRHQDEAVNGELGALVRAAVGALEDDLEFVEGIERGGGWNGEL